MRRAVHGLTVLAIALGCGGSAARPGSDGGHVGGSPAPPVSPASCMATAVAFSGSSLCAADLTGRFRCFEGDASGAKPVTLDAPVVALGASALHHCALTRAGTVWCAGLLHVPELLGHGSDGSLEPVRVALTREARALAVGAEHACAALDDGSVWCWGRSRFGSLGVPSFDPQPTPAIVPGLARAKIVALAAGSYHTCAIDEASNLWCWGLDSNGQLGLRARPFGIGSNGSAEPAGIAGVSKAALGMAHSCALASNGDVACWGTFNPDANAFSSSWHDPMPRRVPLPEPAIDLAAGSAHACAVGKSETVYCWGTHGGTERDSPTPQQVQMRARRIFAGQLGTCALTREGGLVCWGGVELHPSPFKRPTPTRVELPLDFRAVDVSHGSRTVFARDDQGHVAWWGDSYEKGPPTFRPALAPFNQVKLVRAAGEAGCCRISGPNAVAGCAFQAHRDGPHMSPAIENAAAISGVASHACVVKTDGTAWCWGINFQGQLGNASASGHEPAPVQVTALGTDAKDVAVVGSSSCAIKQDGTAWCWGGSSAWSPIQLAGLPPVDQLSFAIDELCLRGRDGQALCGPLRLDQSPAFAPIAVLDGEVQAISTGGEHRCAIKTDGALWCGGLNSQGELGLGHLTPVTGMEPVPGFEAVTAVTTGRRSTCALKRDGSLWCWGANDRGQLGEGTRPINLGPVPLCPRR